MALAGTVNLKPEPSTAVVYRIPASTSVAVASGVPSDQLNRNGREASPGRLPTRAGAGVISSSVLIEARPSLRSLGDRVIDWL